MSISREYFDEWNKVCRVRRVQESWEPLMDAAKKENISVVQKLKSEGYRNYDDFLKSCPLFDMSCSPSSFAELGAGYVLYFHFLGFLMMYTFVASLFLLHPFNYYSEQDNLAAWNWDADGFTTENVENCECLGSNGGYHGPLGTEPRYGQYCKEWDLQYCRDQQGVGATAWDGTIPGMWCCRPWCYAKAGQTRGVEAGLLPFTEGEGDIGCPTTFDERSPSRSNRRQVESAAGVDFVRSYTACQVRNVSCPAELADHDIPSPGIFDFSEPLARNWFGTPGAAGPRRVKKKYILEVYAVITILFGIGLTIARQYQTRVKSKVEQRTTQPNDFAIMVEGLPTTANDEKDLMDWFSQNSLRDKSDVEIVKVVIGWNAAEYRVKNRQLKELQQAAKGLDRNDPHFKELLKQAQEIRNGLKSGSADGASRLTSSGVVVVTFRTQSDQDDCLKRWNAMWAGILYCDPGKCWGLLPGKSLPLYPVGDRPTYKITVTRAANPGDINWEDMGVDTWTVYKRFALTNSAMCLIVLFSFWFCYLMVRIQKIQAYEAPEDVTEYQNDSNGAMLSLLPGLGLMVCKFFITMAAAWAGRKEYHKTQTRKQSSQIVKMSFGFIFTTSFVILYSWAQPKEWYTSPGLVDDVISMIGLLAIRPLGVFLLQKSGIPHNWIRKARTKYGVDIGPSMLKQIADLRAGGDRAKAIKDRALTDEKFTLWNQLAAEATEAKGKLPPKREQEFEKCKREVEFWKKLYENSEMQMMKRYAYAINLFVLAMFYSPLIPFTPLICFCGLCLQYWLDKYALLRFAKAPMVPLSATQAQAAVSLLHYVVPLGMPLFTAYILYPSWPERKRQDIEWFLWVMVPTAVIYCLIPMSVQRTLLCLRCLLGKYDSDRDEDAASHDYYVAQYKWPKHMKYHKSHFLYKTLPDTQNPEFLKAGVAAHVNVDHVKAGYGSAVKALAEEDAEDDDGGAGHRLRATVVDPDSGGRKYGAGSTASSTMATLPPSLSGKSAATLASVAEDKVTDVADVEVIDEAPPAATSSATSVQGAILLPVEPEAHDEGTDHRKHVTWMFEADHGFKAFDNDCQDWIEYSFTQYTKSKGKSRINVKTQGATISVDFKRMTQKREGGNKIRKIKRHDDSDPKEESLD